MISFVTAALALALIAVNAGLLAIWGAWALVFLMPGKSFRGTAPPLDERQESLRDRLRLDVEKLAGDLGERNISRRYKKLVASGEWIESELRKAGLEPRREEYRAEGETVWNVVAEAPGSPQCRQIVIVGAHYDTVPGSPGANDNGSAVAAALALARVSANRELWRTVRFVFFVNEEQPYSHTPLMGSVVHAKGCRERSEDIYAMLCLETLGCYLQEPGSQKYPPALRRFFPSTGDFVAFVGNVKSRSLVSRAIKVFRTNAKLPSEGLAAPETIRDIGRSDHWAFWREGYPALMVTDTANFRYVHYHQSTDTPDRLSYDDFARLVSGLEAVLRDLSEI